ncbi:aminodeoxychorismate synthase, component I, partial [Streptococcus suis]
QGYYVVGYVSYEAALAFEAHFAVKKKRLSQEHLAYFTVHKTAKAEPFPNSYEPVTMPTQWDNATTEPSYQAAIAA